MGINLLDLRKILESNIKTTGNKKQKIENLPLLKQAERVLKITYLEAKLFNAETK